MHHYSKFIECNRQMGSTTELVKAALGVDGYIVVHNYSMKKTILKAHPTLKGERVLTLNDIRNMTYAGRDSRPIFIDAACLCLLTDR
jgi:hypothetical protein